MPNYYCTPTTRGSEKLAQAALLGQPLTLAAIAVGDGNPLEAEPTPEAVMVAERYRMAVNTVYSPAEDLSVVIVEAAVPATVGEFEVNEVGLFDTDGELVAIANYPRTWKTVITNGIGRVLLIRIMVDVGNADLVQLYIDPAVVMATRQYVDLGLNDKVDRAGDTMTGPLTLPGAPSNSLHAATKQYVDDGDVLKVDRAGDTMTGPLTLPGAPSSGLHAATKQYVDEADSLKAPLLSPALLGVPTAPTAAPGANNQQLANTAFVAAALAALVNSSPAALDTLNELAIALGNDPNFATTMTNALAAKMDKAQNLNDVSSKPAARTNLDVFSKGESDARFLGIGAKAVDSDKLDGYDSTAFVRFAHFTGGANHFQLPSGWIVQMGSSVGGTITLPTTFPNAFVHLGATQNLDGPEFDTVTAFKVSNSQIRLYSTNTGGSIDWIAIGY